MHRLPRYRPPRDTARFDVQPRWLAGAPDAVAPRGNPDRHRWGACRGVRLVWLLGYQCSPRFADIGAARCWRLDPTADYGVLHSMARSRVNTDLSIRHGDDSVRVAG